MGFFARIRQKLREDKELRNRVIVGSVAFVGLGTGLYMLRRHGYKSGYARGFTEGYGEARTEEALVLESHVGSDDD